MQQKPAAFSEPRRAVFFGVANPGDDATGMSATELVEPLAKQFRARSMPNSRGQMGGDWVLPSTATKAALSGVLGGVAHAPCVSSDVRQREYSGAPVCQNWPGQGPANDTFYFSEDDVKDDASVAGMIAKFFACH